LTYVLNADAVAAQIERVISAVNLDSLFCGEIPDIHRFEVESKWKRAAVWQDVVR
jgi:hypothetical protein